MGFKLNQSGKFSRSVTIEIAGDNGKWERSTLTATFQQPTTEDLDELKDLKPREVLERKLVGVSDLLDDDGNALPFTPENKAALLSIPAAVAALSRAFWENVVRASGKN